MAPHLTSVTRKPSGAEIDETFPFSVPAIRSLGCLDLDAAVTFFVGENGSGKSTLLEGIAAAAGLPTSEGDTSTFQSRGHAVRCPVLEKKTEEHMSEAQSRGQHVCCLPLIKEEVRRFY